MTEQTERRKTIFASYTTIDEKPIKRALMAANRITPVRMRVGAKFARFFRGAESDRAMVSYVPEAHMIGVDPPERLLGKNHFADVGFVATVLLPADVTIRATSIDRVWKNTRDEVSVHLEAQDRERG